MTKTGKRGLSLRGPSARGAASPTSPRRLQAMEKQRQAIALRKGGATFEQIAEVLGYADKKSAWKAVMAAIRSTLREPAEEVRKLELERLDQLWLSAWRAATDPKGADMEAISICLQIMKRRADLEGLDADHKINITGKLHALSNQEKNRALQAILSRLGPGRGGSINGTETDSGSGPILGGADESDDGGGDGPGPMAEEIAPLFP